MTRAQLQAEREKLQRGLSEARLQVARFEGALEFADYLLSNAPAEAHNEDLPGVSAPSNGGSDEHK